ncbi:MAG: hypothetical protein IV085_02235 [Thiobacillus sp.]|nr:hypothetical protein [Thiobacillus sp.]
MQLLELTPAEQAFLTAEPGAATDFQRRLGQRLASTLTARLHMTTLVHANAETAIVKACPTPVWQPDSALATLWLTRRLGGGRVQGQASFVPRTLIDMLDETLAECWLERQMQNWVPVPYAWEIAAGSVRARLELRLPERLDDMTRWARGVIRRG